MSASRRPQLQMSLDGGTLARTTSPVEPTALSVGDPLGQVFTPPEIAELMASWVVLPPSSDEVRILDPGSGEGALGAKLALRLASLRAGLRLYIEAFEIDPRLASATTQTLWRAAEAVGRFGGALEFQVHATDYLDVWEAVGPRLHDAREGFDVVVQNPPYSKLRKDSPQSVRARDVVHGQPNIYALFLVKSARQLRPGGQLVAIAPRSWLSGSYFRRMRTDFLQRMAIDRVHSFESRGEAFGRDSVLQEAVVFRARRITPGNRPLVHLSLSEGLDDLQDPSKFTFPWSLLCPHGPEHPIRLPETIFQIAALREMGAYNDSLTSLGLRVNTGQVVGFRAREFTAATRDSVSGLVPFIWLENVRRQGLQWTGDPDSRHPPFLRRDRNTERLILPGENLVLVRRFSAKEDRHRVIACHVEAHALGPSLAVENKVNVIRGFKGPDAASMAEGVSAYLNSEVVDQYIRAVSGTTQVNAYELAALPFPSRETLLERWVSSSDESQNGTGVG